MNEAEALAVNRLRHAANGVLAPDRADVRVVLALIDRLTGVDQVPPLPPETSHAATSPGPINCSRRLSFQGRASPRHCDRCGLGPCPFFRADGSAIHPGDPPPPPGDDA